MYCSDTYTNIDVSVVLNVHAEGSLLIKTLYSLRQAAVYASTFGISLELVCVFDCANDATVRAFGRVELYGFDKISVIETKHASLPLSRISGCDIARGRYINLADGDDLISFNALAEMYFQAERFPKPTVFFHEWLMAFGDNTHFARYRNLNKDVLLSFLETNPYTSKAFFPRKIYQEVGFCDVRINGSYAYEDWHFNCEIAARGIDFQCIPNTIIFYRQRDGLLARSNRESVKAIPPSALFNPSVFLSLCDNQTTEIYNDWHDEEDSIEFISGPLCRLLVKAAGDIEPQIEHKTFIESEEYRVIQCSGIRTGRAYLEICKNLVGKTFAHVFFLPWITRGGADRYINNVILAIIRTHPADNILVLCGESGIESVWSTHISESCQIIFLSEHIASAGLHGIDKISLKIIQSCAVNAVLHFRPSLFSFRFFSSFGRALDNYKIFYVFGTQMYLDDDFHVSSPWGPAFLNQNENFIDLFITDSRACLEDGQRQMVSSNKWRLLPTLINPSITRGSAIALTRTKSDRILWASRLEAQKRPNILPIIADIIEKMGLPYEIELWGTCDPSFDVGPLINVERCLHRGFYDKFEDLIHNDYFCFLYTSLFDGVPTVLLEAASNGLPIIAPDVGGVSTFIEDGETGILLPSLVSDVEMAETYVNAIIKLHHDAKLRASLVAKAYDEVVSVYSSVSFENSLADILGASNGG